MNEFDVEVLAAYLRIRIDRFRGPMSCTRFSGGQSNPTFKLTDARGGQYVLRKKPSGPLLPSAHAVEREYRVMKALERTGVPVARMLCLCEDPDVIGTPFYVMGFVEGRVFWDPALPGLDAQGRAAVYEDMNRVVAALHRVDFRTVGLESFGRPDNFIKRQIDRWTKQYRAAQTEIIPAMERLIEWLPAHIPADDAAAICHGDFRIDNMIFHPHEPRVQAVFDWELSTLGHPLADFAYHALPWRLTSQQFRGMAEKKPLPEGIPSEEDYLRRYCERTGRTVDREDYEFFIAFSMFRLAAILQGIVKRAEAGNAASADARETGLKARGIAEAAWEQVQMHG